MAFIHLELDRNAPTRCTQRSLDAKEVGAGRVCCRLSSSTLLCKLPASCTAVTTILDTNVMRYLSAAVWRMVAYTLLPKATVLQRVPELEPEMLGPTRLIIPVDPGCAQGSFVSLQSGAAACPALATALVVFCSSRQRLQ